MSKPREPEPAKLFLSAIYRDAAAANRLLDLLAERLGPIEYSTRELPFEATGYYGAEMGGPLFRRFFVFRELVNQDRLAEIKLFTNALEQGAAVEDKRVVNLDPGLLAMNNLVLATGKAVAHRPYLGSGIYADLTLIFESGSFRGLPWSYGDYASPEMIAFLNRIREGYKQDLREWRQARERV
ncbi:MAG TPA: DUF4416 family protein [bacterium]|nr:DUF4416 family protein [bacterium]